MMKKGTIVGIGICVALTFVLVGILFVNLKTDVNADGRELSDIVKEANVEQKQHLVKVKETEYVEVKQEITSEILQDRIEAMGLLITGNYYFTQVEDYSKIKKFHIITLPESGFVYSYDGVVTAGIDLKDVKVSKDDDKKVIELTLPRSAVQQVDIDFESFKVYSEKEGFWNPLGLEDYNLSMVEFEQRARSEAIQKGLLERADEEAEKVIVNFVKSLIDSKDFQIKVLRK